MKKIYVVTRETFWSGSGTDAFATFTNKKLAIDFADKNQNRCDLRNGCQCFVISRTEFNKKYGIFKKNERYCIEKDGNLSTEIFTSEFYEFQNNCE